MVKLCVGVVCLLMAVLLGVVAHGASPAVDCTTVLMDMSDCIAFVENGSTVAKPDAACCNGFKKVLKNNADCLCEAFNNQQTIPIAIDISKAMTLPAACKATESLPCSVSPAPGPSPVSSPSPSPAPKKPAPHAPAPEQPQPPTHAPSKTPVSPPSGGEPVQAPAPSPEQSGASVLSQSISAALIVAGLAISTFYN